MKSKHPNPVLVVVKLFLGLLISWTGAGSVRAGDSFPELKGWLFKGEIATEGSRIFGTDSSQQLRFDCASIGGGHRFANGLGLTLSVDALDCLLTSSQIESRLGASSYTLGAHWVFRPGGFLGRHLSFSVGAGWGRLELANDAGLGSVVSSGNQVTGEVGLGLVTTTRFRPTFFAKQTRNLQTQIISNQTQIGIGLEWFLDSDRRESSVEVAAPSPSPSPSPSLSDHYARKSGLALKSGFLFRTSKVIDSVAPVPVPLSSVCGEDQVGWRSGLGLSFLLGIHTFDPLDRVPQGRCQVRLTQVPAGLSPSSIAYGRTLGIQYTLDFESSLSIPVALSVGAGKGFGILNLFPKGSLNYDARVRRDISFTVFEAQLEVTLMSSIRPYLGIKRIVGDASGIGLSANLPMFGLLVVF